MRGASGCQDMNQSGNLVWSHCSDFDCGRKDFIFKLIRRIPIHILREGEHLGETTSLVFLYTRLGSVFRVFLQIRSWFFCSKQPERFKNHRHFYFLLAKKYKLLCLDFKPGILKKNIFPLGGAVANCIAIKPLLGVNCKKGPFISTFNRQDKFTSLLSTFIGLLSGNTQITSSLLVEQKHCCNVL